MSLSLVIVDDGVHEVHHGFGGEEHGLEGVEPGVALEEIVGHGMPTAVILQAEIVDVRPVFGEARGAGLELFEAEALGLIPTGHIGRLLETAGLWTTEVTLERLVFDALQPALGVGHDFVATGGEDVSGQIVVA